MDYLAQDITYIAGVGSKRAALLAKELNIRTVEDLLCHFPYKYIDRSRFYRLAEIADVNTFYQIRGKILRFEKKGEGAKMRISAQFSDGHSTVELVWFKGIKYVVEKLRTGIEYVLFGQPTLFNGHYNFAHPEMELPQDLPPAEQIGLQPYYNTTEKMKSNFLNSKALQKIIFNIVTELPNAAVPETLPEYLLQKKQLLNRKSALANIHFPVNENAKQQAVKRLKFEELFYLELNILRFAQWRSDNIKGIVFGRKFNFLNDFFHHHLPFSLTNAQIKVLREIRADINSGRQMNRLLQGDVGSGKTIVALLALLIAVDGGYQAAMMVPTEILASQHFETLSSLLEGTGVNLSLLTGSTRKSERETIAENLQSGDLHILIGTHALIEDWVVFRQLGMVIIDEQHRFGVMQRAKLWQKYPQQPHVLVMTATPIPRTLAMTVYGDLKVSVIDELPPGRKPVRTFHYFDNKRPQLNGFIAEQLRDGRQIYIVYPLIEESEKVDWKALQAGYEHICALFSQFKVSMIHGRMKPAEKDEQMRLFAAGETQIMVATTVIEVGVNVPNASVMVIEDADRFGLSQLHQLRGRVGRGAEQSFCVLMTKYEIAKATRERMKIMTSTNDGFVIAEADMRLRGPGDIEGTQQSGLPIDLKIAELAHDTDILEEAQAEVLAILHRDPQLSKPENEILPVQLKKMKKQETIDFSKIS